MVPWSGYSTPCSWPTFSTKPIARATAVKRIIGQAEGQRQEEQGLGVSRAFDVWIQRRVDRHQRVSLGVVELTECAVVHPQPAVVTEWMAVRALHRRAGGGADVGKQQGSTNLTVTSLRLMSFHAGSMLLNTAGSTPSPYQPIPKPSPLVVVAPEGVQALVDDRVLGFEEQLFGEGSGLLSRPSIYTCA